MLCSQERPSFQYYNGIILFELRARGAKGISRRKIENILYILCLLYYSNIIFFNTDSTDSAASLQLWGLELFSCPPTTTLLRASRLVNNQILVNLLAYPTPIHRGGKACDFANFPLTSSCKLLDQAQSITISFQVRSTVGP